MSTYRSRTDQAVANDTGTDQRLMCSAHGCPNLWSTSDGNLCRWHADAPPHRWPEVTQDMQNHVTDRAYAAGFDKQPARSLSADEKRGILRRAAAVFKQPEPRAWIAVLRAKQRAGIPLSAMQKHCLAQVREQSES